MPAGCPGRAAKRRRKSALNSLHHNTIRLYPRSDRRRNLPLTARAVLPILDRRKLAIPRENDVAHRPLLYCQTFRLSTQIAEVVELADALRSGRSEGNLVGVRVPPSAPTVMKGIRVTLR